MINTLLIVPDATGIRNYLYSDMISFIKDDSNIFIWSPLAEEAFDNVSIRHNTDLHYTRLYLTKEKLLGRWLRETATFARLLWNTKKVNNPTILTNWNYNPKGGFTKRIFNKINRWIGSLISNRYDWILVFEKLARNLWSRDVIKCYEASLKQYSIDKIIITHQRVAHLMPICLAAKNLGLEVFTVIYSWDNLPKARLHVLADKYLVWSAHMKEEMAIYYPEISQDKVIITGTPQFEFYHKKELIIEREVFAKKYGLDASKRWILYSGGDKLTSPYDQNYLEDLVDSLTEEPGIQIIFRRSPADFSNRFVAVLKNFEGQIFSLDPIWKTGSSWSSNIPLFDDFALLSNIAYHCELAVNVGSTIALDFANFNKPTLYINYNHEMVRDWDIKVVNNFQHFKSMRDLNAVVFVNHKNEWYSVFDHVINNPDIVAIDRQQWYDRINLNRELPASKIISDLILS